MSLADERKALLDRLARIDRDREVTSRQLGILEDAVRRMAEAEHGTAILDVVPGRGGRKLQSTHPLALRCVEVAGSVKAAANILGVSPSSVRSWYAHGKEARDIPADMIDRLKVAPWNLPASVWIPAAQRSRLK